MHARNVRLTAAALAAAAVALPAAAETSPWYLGVAQAFTHNSNVQRVADGFPINGSTISTTSLLAGLDQPIGRQRVFGTGSVQMNRYSGLSRLNNTSYALRGGLDWSTVERISGTVSLGLNQSLAQFSPGDGPTVPFKALEKSNNFDAVVRVGLVTAVTLEAGISHRTFDYGFDSAVAGPGLTDRLNSLEYRQDAVRLAGRYTLGGSLTLGAGLRHAQTTYPRYLAGVADDVKRDDLDLTAAWVASGASTLNLRLSGTRTRHSVAAVQDISGMTGILAWRWQPTGKTTLTTRLQRDDGSELSFDNQLIPGNIQVVPGDTSRVTTQLSVQGDYEATAKIMLTGTAALAHRSLRDTITGPVRNDSDDTAKLALRARWQPTRSTQLSCDLTHERRSGGGVISQPYRVNTLGCAVQFVLQ